MTQGPDHADSRVSPRPRPESKLGMVPCERLERPDSVARTSETQEDIADSCPTPEPLKPLSTTSHHQAKVSRTSAKGTSRAEGVSPT